jgi:hypothetical protein
MHQRAGFGPIVHDTEESRKPYRDLLGIPFKEETAAFIPKLFRAQRALRCGRFRRPRGLVLARIPGLRTSLPHRWLEFDVDSVEEATAELESSGYQMLVKNTKRRASYW